MKFRMIPYIQVVDLPQPVEEELAEWNDELPFHSATGVFHVRRDTMERLPLFRAWMIEIGAWTEAETNLGDFATFRAEFPAGDWTAYQAWLGDRKDRLSVAMAGT